MLPRLDDKIKVHLSYAALEAAFIAAVEKKQYPLVEEYLAGGATGALLGDSDGNSVYHLAINDHDEQMLKLLLKYPKCNPVIGNSQNEKPSQTAAIRGYWDFVMLIAKHRRERAGEYNYGLALLYAAHQNSLMAVAALLKANAPVNQNCDSQSRNHIIHYAVTNRNIKMVQLLIDAGADLSIKNALNETPIVMAAKLQYWDVVIVIARLKKDKNDKFDYKAALAIAVDHNRYHAAQALLKASMPKTSLVGEKGNSLLHDAVRNANSAMVALLIKYNVHAVDYQNESLVLAQKLKYTECMAAFADPKKYMIQNPAEFYENIKVNCYLLLDKTNRYNCFAQLPTEISWIIIQNAFSNYGPDFFILDREKDHFQISHDYVLSRQSRIYLKKVSQFIEDYSSLSFLRQFANLQSTQSLELIDKLTQIVGLNNSDKGREVMAKYEIDAFVQNNRDRASRAMNLLFSHGLIKQPRVEMQAEAIAFQAKARVD